MQFKLIRRVLEGSGFHPRQGRKYNYMKENFQMILST
jgi:hypothetical protein